MIQHTPLFTGSLKTHAQLLDVCKSQGGVTIHDTAHTSLHSTHLSSQHTPLFTGSLNTHAQLLNVCKSPGGVTIHDTAHTSLHRQSSLHRESQNTYIVLNRCTCTGVLFLEQPQGAFIIQHTLLFTITGSLKFKTHTSF